VIQAYPGIVASVRANRAFLARVVRFLALNGLTRHGLFMIERYVHVEPVSWD
jgi:hypothetical protein